ncbi:MAG: T9SS type A sorting domain-containing protein, partial [Hymenobacter sp.]
AETSTPLPVTLVAFRAVAQGTSAVLGWVVAQEADISYYDVERSLDGRTFQPVGRVMAKGGASLTYAYTDALGQLASSQPVYYRLRIVEPGQPATYSPVAALRYSAADAALVAWPTVFATELHLDGTALPEDLQRIELLDAQGRVVYTQPLPAGSRVASFSGQGLAAGLYLLRVATATQLYQQRVVRE